MKIREWVRRNCLEGLAVMFLSLSMVGVYLNIADARAAHAQKPAEQPKTAQQIAAGQIADQVIQKLGENSCTIVCQGGLPKWIEQHCVAVITEKHDVHHKLGPSAPIFDDRTEWDENIPEQTLKLRCTPDKEGGK